MPTFAVEQVLSCLHVKILEETLLPQTDRATAMSVKILSNVETSSYNKSKTNRSNGVRGYS